MSFDSKIEYFHSLLLIPLRANYIRTIRQAHDRFR
jgi:hypothetical protein